MTDQDPQQTWEDYYRRKRSERLAEAEILWDQMESAGVNEVTVLALDFVHFGRNENDARDLSVQLSEHYSVAVEPADQEGYFFVRGTTRPEGITLTKEQHTGWVEFMCDVAQSYACVFSTWSLEAPKLSKTFPSEDVESAC
ncbi:MAG: hypothetical protein SD837_00020 [Candidatus Electrothrix scaldis]|nr:MAG: hypothetical protein SD837_00020 [Candidatus Electrothrix sp. GW3-3]